MKILVTGAKGFIGKNLIAELKNRKTSEILEFDRENSLEELKELTKGCDLVFHLAGVNRPEKTEEFKEGNLGFTNILLENLRENGNRSPIVFSSSVWASVDNPYGRSKLDAETVLVQYSKETGIPVYVYRLSNVFGKWCRPSYNSVVATFCHNIANHLPIQVNDPQTILRLVYIDDVVSSFAGFTTGETGENLPDRIYEVKPVHSIKLGDLESLLRSFCDMRSGLELPDLSDPLTGKLYATYLSYLPSGEFAYDLKMNTDNRGSFTEFLHTPDRGQISVNISKPGIIKGNHWHHTKNEKFLVVSGKGVIRFRRIGTQEVKEYHVSGEKLTVLDIPPGYTHNIENIGSTDMVTIMWASEAFDPQRTDTIFEEV